MNQLIRLSKLMSLRGICSRREADRYIENGQVQVNGEILSTLGSKVRLDVQISLHPNAKKMQKSKVTILLNKPLGYLSVHPENGYPTAKELLTPERYWGEVNSKNTIFDQSGNIGVAGRLDINSKGLLVFSQDGTIVKQIIGPENNMEKEYLVHVEGVVTTGIIKKLCYGLFLDGKKLKPAVVKQLKPMLLKFVLREGKKRQIRRMCELVGLSVTSIKRVRIGNVVLGKLPIGNWRYLGEGEFF